MAITFTSIDLIWTQSTDNIAVTDYKIYKSTDGLIYDAGISVGNVLLYTYPGLTQDTYYWFKVTALDAIGNESLVSNIETDTTLKVDTQNPTAVVLSLVSVNHNTALIEWTAPTDDVEVDFVRLYNFGVPIVEVDPRITEYLYQGLDELTNYSIQALVVDKLGNNSPVSNTLLFETTTSIIPDAPYLIAGEPDITGSSVYFSWTNSFTSPITGTYEMWQDGVLVDTSLNLEHTYTGLSEGTEYYFKVRALDEYGTYGPFSNSYPVTTKDLTPPVMTTFYVVSTTTTSVTYGWDLATDNVGVHQYILNMPGVPNSTAYVIHPTNQYTFYGLYGSGSFNATIQAEDFWGNPSNILNATGSTKPWGYGAITNIGVSVNDQTSSATACADTFTDTRWTNGDPLYPQVNDWIFHSEIGNDPISSLNRWFKHDQGFSAVRNTTGYILEVFICNYAPVMTTFEVTATTSSSLFLEWDAATDSDGTIDHYEITHPGRAPVIIPSYQLSYNYRGLQFNTYHGFNIVAVDNGGRPSIALAVAEWTDAAPVMQTTYFELDNPGNGAGSTCAGLLNPTPLYTTGTANDIQLGDEIYTYAGPRVLFDGQSDGNAVTGLEYKNESSNRGVMIDEYGTVIRVTNC